MLGSSRVNTSPVSASTTSAVPFQPVTNNQIRPYSNGGGGKSSGRSEGDLLVDELQELYPSPIPPYIYIPTNNKTRYEIATDEFEIATDSTDSSTIYAASDRESARDALNQLSVVYTLYTTEVTSPEFQELQKQQEAQQGKQANVEGETSQVVSTNFNPAEVSNEARAEVRKRVGQRVRELRNAMENLEERAKED